jgi:hypothetical protein
MKEIKGKISLSILSIFGLMGLFSFQNCAPPKLTSNMQSNLSSLSIPNSTLSSTAVNGLCGTQVDSCLSGEFMTIESAANDQWSCLGSNGGLTVMCASDRNASAPTVSQIGDSFDQPPVLPPSDKTPVSTPDPLVSVPDANNQPDEKSEPSAGLSPAPAPSPAPDSPTAPTASSPPSAPTDPVQIDTSTKSLARCMGMNDRCRYGTSVGYTCIDGNAAWTCVSLDKTTSVSCKRISSSCPILNLNSK